MTIGPIITLDGTPGDWVMWRPTMKFRWLARQSKGNPLEVESLVLQQMYQGSDGTQRWEDVPTVDETQV